MVEKSLRDLDIKALSQRIYTPSPAAWEDQVLYFLMLDRFSDGNEQGYFDNDRQPVTGGTTPLFQPGDSGNAIQTDSGCSPLAGCRRRLGRGHAQGA